MGFRLTIEADYRSEVLQNIHPEGKDSGGKAVLAFLVGLSNYLALESDDNLDDIDQWYKKSEQVSGFDYAPLCQPIVDCMWSDGGDPNMGRERWQPIDRVIAGVEHLLQILNNPELEQLDGFFVPEDTVADFEALLHNLKLLQSRGNTTIRLNFH